MVGGGDTRALTRQSISSILCAVAIEMSRRCVMAEEGISDLREQLAEAQSESERLQVMAADSEARALHLEELNQRLRGQIEVAEGELASERQRLDESSARLTAFEEELATKQEDNQALHARLQAAAGKYREALLAAAPELPEELVAGESIEEVEEAAERSRQTVRQVRERLESQAQVGRVPTGSPPRGAPDFSALSPIEKIRLGLNQKRS
jgi:chromosome segregation ATPase